ncbi:MAG: hypothetical protein ABF791_11895, partial [Acetobacter sp.]
MRRAGTRSVGARSTGAQAHQIEAPPRQVQRIARAPLRNAGMVAGVQLLQHHLVALAQRRSYPSEGRPPPMGHK